MGLSVKLAQKQIETALLSCSDSARMDANVLLGHCLGKTRTWLMTWPDIELSAVQQMELDASVARRIKGEPIAYIVGEQEFWSLPFKVNSSTLIPRPETELLVELALDKMTVNTARILDLGTGSGAIPLALKSERPQWVVTAIDFSNEALTVAKNNAETLSLAVNFIRSDWFSSVPNQAFDLVISNPPYINQSDIHLSQGDVRFEPKSALVADKNGFGDILRISQDASRYLTVGGLLMFEHGFEQGEGARRILRDNGFSRIKTQQDLAGLDRVTFGYWDDC